MEKITNQHGDLILKRIGQIPPTAVELKGITRYVLLKGEGVNTHEIVWEKQDEAQVFFNGKEVYLEVSSPIRLVHLEHGTQTVSPGLYERVIEREFDYEEMEARNAKD